MKKMIFATAIAMMCFSANAFAEDDGYGNDIPPARAEGTVDDGYGNKLPSNDNIEYKTFGEARAAANGRAQGPAINFGAHVGFGFGSYLDYPSNAIVLEHIGENEWMNVFAELGGVIKYRVNNFLYFVPELNFGFNVTSRDKGRGYDWYYGPYQVSETRVLINFNMPLSVRVMPLPFLYVEAGAILNFNLATSHTNDFYDMSGNPLERYKRNGEYVSIKENLEEWEVKPFVPSILAGIGGSFKLNGCDFDFGIRITYDLIGIEKDDKIDFFDESTGKYLTNEKGEKLIVENNTRMFGIQFIMNYYLF